MSTEAKALEYNTPYCSNLTHWAVYYLSEQKYASEIIYLFHFTDICENIDSLQSFIRPAQPLGSGSNLFVCVS